MTLGSRLPGTALLLLTFILCLCLPFALGLWTRFFNWQRPPTEPALYEPPATVQTFITASAADDTANVWRVTSSVYWLELRRRGVNLDEEHPDTILRTLTYVPIGGARDGYGYGRWLYSTLAVTRRGDRILTIWRLDTDPSDLILWAEPGVLLVNSCDRPIRDLTPPPDSLSSDHGRANTVVMSARCPGSSQGYYVLQAVGARVFTFRSIHEDGQAYLPNWTFGHILNSREAKRGRGYDLVDRVFKSPTEDAYRSYLRDLGQAPASASNLASEAGAG